MGNQYIEKPCLRCKQTTVHRFFRRFGKLSTKWGSKAIRREVTWCTSCQYRIIDNKRKNQKRQHHIRQKKR